MQFQVWDESVISGRNDQGFCVTFNNGYEVSVTWGRGKYGDGHQAAEVAVFTPSGQVESDVDGWQTPEQVAAIMSRVAAL